jgi:hypothetical protein
VRQQCKSNCLSPKTQPYSSQKRSSELLRCASDGRSADYAPCRRGPVRVRPRPSSLRLILPAHRSEIPYPAAPGGALTVSRGAQPRDFLSSYPAFLGTPLRVGGDWHRPPAGNEVLGVTNKSAAERLEAALLGNLRNKIIKAERVPAHSFQRFLRSSAPSGSAELLMVARKASLPAGRGRTRTGPLRPYVLWACLSVVDLC